MFQPNNRSLLSEQLQAPRGFELVQAIGTTFTLDMSTTLGVPLSFASRSFSDHEDLGIIAALAQNADRLTIFTQAGEIGVGVRSDLITLLEDVIQPVHPPRGIFHPKVWLLEYAAGEERTYRFLCNSRNLTEDRSWDLSVRLDGVCARDEERAAARRANKPLTSFLRRLPELTVRPLPEGRMQRIEKFAEQIADVQWELPPGVTEVGFHYLNGSGDRTAALGTDPVASMLNVRAGNALIISPFLSPEGIETVSRIAAHSPRIVSRAETLDQLPSDTVNNLADTYMLDDILTLDEGADAHEGGTALSGLHAKAVFVSERRRPSRARAYIGSANITNGGLRNNIEMMVELRGHVRNLGPDSVLEALGPMLETYVPAGGVEPDRKAEAIKRLEARVRALSAGRIHARVFGDGPYAMRAWYEERIEGILGRMQSEGITVEWRPLSTTGGGVPLTEQEHATSEFSELRTTQVTPFLQLSVSQRVEGEKVTVRTVVSAELHDDIAGRRDAILAQGIADGDQFLKLLTLLLDPDHHALNAQAVAGSATGEVWGSTTLARGLFESLVQSFARGDEGLDTAHRVLTQLRRSTEVTLELPDGFEELWDNIWQARSKRVKARGKRG